MEWSKIKNIILLILLGVNLFLVVLLVYEEGRSAQYLSLIHIFYLPERKFSLPV